MTYPNTIMIRVALCTAQLALAGLLCGQHIPSTEAVMRAEQFVHENGYTDAPDSVIKAHLDHERIEMSRDRAELLKSRRNMFQPKAIGIKPTDTGWGVAFDYVNHQGSCRVVVMDKAGTQCRMQHKDGIRAYWTGFENCQSAH